MNLSQIIEVLPLQVYVRRGELVIHFSTPADLVGRLAETSAALSDLDRQADLRTDGKADRGRRGNGRPISTGAGPEGDADGSTSDPNQPSAFRLTAPEEGGVFLWPRKNSQNSSAPRPGGSDRSPIATSISATPSSGTDSVQPLRLCVSQVATKMSTHRRLRRIWERGLATRWAFPGFRTHSEFYYYLDNRTPLDLLAERRRLEIRPQMLDEIRAHREKDYAGAAIRGQHMQLGFLNHGLMVARMHFMIEMACRKSGGGVSLEAWCQGGQLAGHKVEVPKVRSSKTGGEFFWQEVDETERLPVGPDALFTLRFTDRPEGHQLVHFCYEADRGSMVMTDMLKKFRGYYHFIKKQQKHREAFHVHPIRAILVETTEEARGKKLMELVGHPLVAGPGKRAGLFWLSIAPLFTDPTTGSSIPRCLDQPEAIFDPIWALPDHSLHGLGDPGNSAGPRAQGG